MKTAAWPYNYVKKIPIRVADNESSQEKTSQGAG
jgi:hypothetical protein